MVRSTHPDQLKFDFEDPNAKRLKELQTLQGMDLIRHAVKENLTTIAEEESAWNDHIHFEEVGDTRSGKMAFGGAEHREFINTQRRPVFENVLKVMMEKGEPVEKTTEAVENIRTQQRQFMRSLSRRTKKK